MEHLDRPGSRTRQSLVAACIGRDRWQGGLLVAPDTVETPLGTILGDRAYNWPRGCHVEVLLRPDDVVLGVEDGIECKITERAFRGAETLYTLRFPDDGEPLSLMPSHYDFGGGERVKVRLEVDHLVLFQG